MGAAFAVVLLRAAGGDTRPSRRLMRRLLVIGRHIFVRTAALMSAFIVAGAVIARFGDASLAAHQIVAQLWLFLALVLDSIAIAGQVLVGRGLGAGDADRAYDASVRMIWLSVYAGVVFAVVHARARRRAAARLHERRRSRRPGAGDLAALRADAAAERRGLRARRDPDRRRRRTVPDVVDGDRVRGVARPSRSRALAFDWGIVGVWAALVVLICVRLVLMGWRFAGRRWLVTGWAT